MTRGKLLRINRYQQEQRRIDSTSILQWEISPLFLNVAPYLPISHFPIVSHYLILFGFILLGQITIPYSLPPDKTHKTCNISPCPPLNTSYPCTHIHCHVSIYNIQNSAYVCIYIQHAIFHCLRFYPSKDSFHTYIYISYIPLSIYWKSPILSRRQKWLMPPLPFFQRSHGSWIIGHFPDEMDRGFFARYFPSLSGHHRH